MVMAGFVRVKMSSMGELHGSVAIITGGALAGGSAP